jgi:hypothetical protein
MNPFVAGAAWVAFVVLLALLAARSALSERRRDPDVRPWVAIHRLDLATGAVSTVLVVLLCSLLLPTLLG